MNSAKEEMPDAALPGLGCLFLFVAGFFLFFGVIFRSDFILDLGYFTAALAYIFAGLGLLIFLFSALEGIGRAITLMIFGYVLIRLFPSETDIVPELIGYLFFAPASAYLFISQTKRFNLNLNSKPNFGQAFLKYFAGIVLSLAIVWAGMKLIELSIHSFHYLDRNVYGRSEFVQNAGRWNNLLNGFALSFSIAGIPVLVALGLFTYVFSMNTVFRKLDMADQIPDIPKFRFLPKTALASRKEISEYITQNPGKTDFELMSTFPGLTPSFLQKIYANIFSSKPETGKLKTALMLKHIQANPDSICKIELSPDNFRTTIIPVDHIANLPQETLQTVHDFMSKIEAISLQKDGLDTGVIHETDSQFYFLGMAASGSVFFENMEFSSNEEKALTQFRDNKLTEVFAFPSSKHISRAKVMIENLEKDLLRPRPID